MKKCTHQFIVLCRESKYSLKRDKERKENKNVCVFVPPDISGMRIGCSLCGQNRIIWNTGELEILKGGEQ